MNARFNNVAAFAVSAKTVFTLSVLFGLAGAYATIYFPKTMILALTAAGIATGLITPAAIIMARRMNNLCIRFQASPDRLVRYHGMCFLFWFTGHNLFWAAAGLLSSALILKTFGPQTWAVAFAAGSLSCSFCAISGAVYPKNSAMLGLCWSSPVPDAAPGILDRSGASVLLWERYGQALAHDLNQPDSVLSRIAGVLDLGRIGCAERIVDIGKSDSTSAKREIINRGKTFGSLFAVSIILFLPVPVFFGFSANDIPAMVIGLDRNGGGQKAGLRPDKKKKQEKPKKKDGRQYARADFNGERNGKSSKLNGKDRKQPGKNDARKKSIFAKNKPDEDGGKPAKADSADELLAHAGSSSDNFSNPDKVNGKNANLGKDFDNLETDSDIGENMAGGNSGEIGSNKAGEESNATGKQDSQYKGNSGKNQSKNDLGMKNSENGGLSDQKDESGETRTSGKGDSGGQCKSGGGKENGKSDGKGRAGQQSKGGEADGKGQTGQQGKGGKADGKGQTGQQSKSGEAGEKGQTGQQSKGGKADGKGQAGQQGKSGKADGKGQAGQQGKSGKADGKGQSDQQCKGGKADGKGQAGQQGKSGEADGKGQAGQQGKNGKADGKGQSGQQCKGGEGGGKGQSGKQCKGGEGGGGKGQGEGSGGDQSGQGEGKGSGSGKSQAGDKGGKGDQKESNKRSAQGGNGGQGGEASSYGTSGGGPATSSNPPTVPKPPSEENAVIALDLPNPKPIGLSGNSGEKIKDDKHPSVYPNEPEYGGGKKAEYTSQKKSEPFQCLPNWILTIIAK